MEFIAHIFLGLLIHIAQLEPPTFDVDTGFLIVRYPKVMRLFSILLPSLIAGWLTVWLIRNPPQGQGAIDAAYGLYALIAAIGIPWVWENFRFKMVVNSQGLEYRSPWRGEHFIHWEEIDHVRCGSESGFDIRTREGRNFSVPHLASGTGAFAEACQRILAPGQIRKGK
jgi:hypothetical protein